MTIDEDHLPEPDCGRGYTEQQLAEIVGDDALPRFRQYMIGKTQGICEGPPHCDVAHGIVSYPSDVRWYAAHTERAGRRTGR